MISAGKAGKAQVAYARCTCSVRLASRCAFLRSALSSCFCRLQKRKRHENKNIIKSCMRILHNRGLNVHASYPADSSACDRPTSRSNWVSASAWKRVQYEFEVEQQCGKVSFETLAPVSTSFATAGPRQPVVQFHRVPADPEHRTIVTKWTGRGSGNANDSGSPGSMLGCFVEEHGATFAFPPWLVLLAALPMQTTTLQCACT